MCATKYRNTQSYIRNAAVYIIPYNVSLKVQKHKSYIRNAAVYIIPYNVSLKIQKYTELHQKCSSVQNTI